ncbi:MAG: JAB domain-containing protein, partial [Firmicutes bacterium]|nr:JAB domain-containing protein [Bacillota bacterium]
EFGNLDNLINSPPNAIAERTGVSINTAVLISMVGKIHSRQRLANRIGIKLDTVEKVKNYCVDLLKNKTVEVFYIICMNSKMNVISNIEVAKGSETQVSIDSKDLMRRICGMGTVTAVCAHNHPGGEDDFSIEDIKSTIVLKSCLKKCSIKLTDHILVYDNKAVSMVETKKFNL